MAFARLYISKPDPPTTLAATPLVGQIKARPNPPPHQKRTFLDPYAYYLKWYDKIWQGKFSKHPPPLQQKDGSFAPACE